ncbi:DNA cytosine methyltransferase [Helicobacter pylori]|uniref:DNA cytosine methyltransferase n=1 Tax=Helicobacter pylori TaxID=210 RepID=UPI000FDE49E2|nr:DNA cytosine methyltransferase [Helicobacter pylori]RVY16091.1 DNA cytosine methyltransferase [Helicobacter pylori]
MYKVADIFCGAGGLSYGFSVHPHFELVWANDIDKDAILSYQANHKEAQTILCDIAQLHCHNLPCVPIDILLGGPPCQSYSTLGKRKMDGKANLFKEYLRLLDLVKPKIFVFENVVGLMSMQKGQLFKQICNAFKERDYILEHAILNALDYGVPQIRERVILVGALKSFKQKFYFPKPIKTHFSLKDALGDLPPIQSGENGDALGYLKNADNVFLEFVRNSKELSEHSSPKNNEKLIKIMQTLKDGQSKDDLPESLRPKSGYTNTYAKMWWEKPAPTITRNFSTPSSSRCIHPRDSRALSIREGARLQSFPDNYKFYGSGSAKRLQIGNAVPPLLSVALAHAVFDFLRGKNV